MLTAYFGSKGKNTYINSGRFEVLLQPCFGPLFIYFYFFFAEERHTRKCISGVFFKEEVCKRAQVKPLGHIIVCSNYNKKKTSFFFS